MLISIATVGRCCNNSVYLDNIRCHPSNLYVGLPLSLNLKNWTCPYKAMSCMANNADPDQAAPVGAAYLDLHCLFVHFHPNIQGRHGNYCC